MAVSYDDARELLDDLEPDYQERHRAHARLRDFWHGRYWDDVDSSQRGVASIFRDLGSQGQSDVGPDVKLVRNLIFDVCLKYQSFLSSLPMIRTFVDRPDSRRARAQANLKERALYGAWSQANMTQQLNRGAWFGPLMGDWFLGIWPDFDQTGVKAIVRSPEHAFPVPSYDHQSLDALLFCWKTTPARAKRAFPNWGGSKSGDSTKEIEILEYSDGSEFGRWIDGERVNGVEHNLGFNLFDQVPFIHVPGEPWNHGAVEQSVNLVEAGNALYSLLMQAMFENVFPRLVLEDPMKFSEEIDTGPGAVIGVNQGGRAYFLSPPVQTLSESVAMLQENERAIKQDTSMPDVNFGQFEASVITGKAVNALQGAGTGSVIEMVQGSGIGAALQSWNEKAITIFQRMFADETVRVYGMAPKSMLDLNPRQFALSFKGSDLVGSPRNEVVFSPYVDLHNKLVMNLQALGAGIVSKEYTREQIGISDSEAMQEEITEEVIEEAVVTAMVQGLTNPQEADTVEAQALAYLAGQAAQGSPGQASGAPPQLGSALPPGGRQVAPEAGGGAAAAAPFPLPPGSPVAGPPQGPQQQAGVTLAMAQQALQGVQLNGRAWLVGEIVQTGTATGPVDVAVTDQSDQQAIADAAQFPIRFHRVTGEPQEQAVEIT